ncbi:hypothetical protein ABBQ38_014636 [Trebouxia sp. C0009 RCD-2024]
MQTCTGHYQPVSDALGQTVPGLSYCGRINTPLLRRGPWLPVLFASQQQQKRKPVLSSKRQPGPFIFIGSYAIATVILVPASALTLAAGFLYGPVTGTAIVSAASTLGATLAFLVSRYLARPFVLHKLQDYPKLAAVQSKVSADGANVVFLLRLSPLVPFTLLNYALGVTEVPLASYIGTSWAGMLPATIAYVYLGSTGRSATDAGSGSFDTVKFGLYAVGAVATLLVTKLVADRASAALEDEDLRNS